MFAWRGTTTLFGLSCSLALAALAFSGCGFTSDADDTALLDGDGGAAPRISTDVGTQETLDEPVVTDSSVTPLVVAADPTSSSTDPTAEPETDTSTSTSTSTSTGASATTTSIDATTETTAAADGSTTAGSEQPGSPTTAAKAATTAATTLTTTTTTNATTATTVEATTTTAQQTTSAVVNRSAFLSVNFQSSPTGNYGDAQVRTDWGGGTRYATTEGRATILEEGGNRYLRVSYPDGKFGNDEAGAQWVLSLGDNAAEELYVSYRVRFVGNFDFVRGGKLPGLAGGAGNTGGNKPNGNDGWSGRMMWRTNGDAVQYVYHPDQPTIYGEDFDWSRGFPRDTWVQVETRIRMNTPGQRDGIVQSWMNGQRVLNRTDVRFRDTGGFAIDQFRFETFFGGNSADWAPSKDELIDFDDFVVSGSPITH